MGGNGIDQFGVQLCPEAQQAFGPPPGQSVDTLQPLHHRPASVLHGQLSVYSYCRIAVIPISEAILELSAAEATQVSELPPSRDIASRPSDGSPWDRTWRGLLRVAQQGGTSPRPRSPNK